MIKHRDRIGNIFGPVINWTKEFEFSMEYRTAINTFNDGTESRESVRTFPRLSMKYTAHFMDVDAEDFIAEFSRDASRTYYFPLPFRTAFATVTDDMEITFDTLPFWVVPGAHLVLQGPQRELVQVMEVDEGRVTLADFVRASVSSLQVFAAIPVQISGNIRTTMITRDIYEMKVDLVSADDLMVFPIQDFVPDMTFEDQPVILDKPNWISPVDQEFFVNTRVVDFGFGPRVSQMMRDHVNKTFKYSYLTKEYSEVERYISMVHYFTGKNNPFWIPAWSNLLDIAPGNPANTQEVRVTNKFLGRDYSGSKTHRNLFAIFNNGTIAARKINGFFPTANPPYMQVTAAFPQLMTRGNVQELVWLTLSRSYSDEFTFVFKSSKVATMTLTTHLLAAREVQL